MHKKSPQEEPFDMSRRLRALQLQDPFGSLGPREPDPEPDPEPAPERHHVEAWGGRMYVLGAKDGPQFKPATWLHPHAADRAS